MSAVAANSSESKPSFESTSIRHREFSRAVSTHGEALTRFIAENRRQCERMAAYFWRGGKGPNGKTLAAAGFDLEDMESLCLSWAVSYCAPRATQTDMPEPGLLMNYLRQRFVEMMKALAKRLRSIDPSKGLVNAYINRVGNSIERRESASDIVVARPSLFQEIEEATMSASSRAVAPERSNGSSMAKKEAKRKLAERLAALPHSEALVLLADLAARDPEQAPVVAKLSAWMKDCTGDCYVCKTKLRVANPARFPFPPQQVLPQDVRNYLQKTLCLTGGKKYGPLALPKSAMRYDLDLRLGARILGLLTLNIDGTHSPTQAAYELCATAPDSEEERAALLRAAKASPTMIQLGLLDSVPNGWQNTPISSYACQKVRYGVRTVTEHYGPHQDEADYYQNRLAAPCDCPEQCGMMTYISYEFAYKLVAIGMSPSTAERRASTMLSWRKYLLGSSKKKSEKKTEKKIADFKVAPERPPAAPQHMMF